MTDANAPMRDALKKAFGVEDDPNLDPDIDPTPIVEEPPTPPSEEEATFKAFVKDAEMCQMRYRFGLHFSKDLVYYGLHLGSLTRTIEDAKGNPKTITLPVRYILTNNLDLCRLSNDKTLLKGNELFFKNLTFLENLYSISPTMVKSLKLNNLCLENDLTPLTPRTLTPHTQALSEAELSKLDAVDTYCLTHRNSLNSLSMTPKDPLKMCVRVRCQRPGCQQRQPDLPPTDDYHFTEKVGIEKSENPLYAHSREEEYKYDLRNGCFFTPEAKQILTHPKEGVEVKIRLFQLFELIREKLKYYVGLPEEGDYDLLALYAMATYIYPVFPSFPYLQVSAIKESGKTRLLNTMAKLCFSSLFTSSQKVSPLFRFIDGNGGTVIFDEAEGIALEPEKIQIINAGYSKAGGGVLLTDKNNHRLQEMFDTYSPKIFGSINNLPPTVITRSIRIGIEKSALDIYDDRIADNDEDFRLIRDLLYVFGLKYGLEVQKIFEEYTRKPEGVRHRYWELYKPLVCIAECMGNKEFVEGLMEYISDKVYLEKKARLLEDEDSIAMCALVKLVVSEKFFDIGTLTVAIREERGAMDIMDNESGRIRHMDEAYKHIHGNWVADFLRRVNLPRKGTAKTRAVRFSGSRGRFLKPKDVVDQAIRMNVVEIDPLTNEYRLITDGSVVSSVKPLDEAPTQTLEQTTPTEPSPIVEKPEIRVEEVKTEVEPPQSPPTPEPTITETPEPIQEITPLTPDEGLEMDKQCSATRRDFALMLYNGQTEQHEIKFALTNKHHDYDFIQRVIQELKTHGYITENNGCFILLKEKDELRQFFED